MRQLMLLIVMAGALTFGATALAGGKPVWNETQYFVNEPFGGIGPNCATGRDSLSDGMFSGEIRTRVTDDGVVKVDGSIRGTDTLYDLDDAGVPASEPTATTEFRQKFRDLFFATGCESHKLTLGGTLTLLSTGQLFRFHVVFRLELDETGAPVHEFEKVRCA